jgi:hypothetical protein
VPCAENGQRLHRRGSGSYENRPEAHFNLAIAYNTDNSLGEALQGRGTIREGNFADVTIFDSGDDFTYDAHVGKRLLAGARRLVQELVVIKATIVNGKAPMRNNEHTDALPGNLIRSASRSPPSLSHFFNLKVTGFGWEEPCPLARWHIGHQISRFPLSR